MTLNKIVVSDWLDYIKAIPDDSIDLVLTDPAYESMLRWQGVGTTARMGMGKEGSGSDDADDKFFPTIPNADLPDLVQHIYRVLRPGCHAYIMCDDITERLIYRYAVEELVFTPTDQYGTRAYRRLIWDKMVPGIGYPPGQYENVIFLWKGIKRRRDGTRRDRRPLNDKGITDILRFKRVPGFKTKAHNRAIVPTQKPVELFELLIKQSTQPGETVLDLFMGAGTTAVAAIHTGRNWMGCEILQKHADRANLRIARELGQIVQPNKPTEQLALAM